MKISLINPPFLFPQDRVTDYGGEVYQPLGLAYIAAVLEKKNYEIEVIDAIAEDYSKKLYKGKYLVGLTYEDIGKIIKVQKPSIVGITAPFTAHYPSALQVAKVVKNISHEIVVVLGGLHVSAVPEKCMNDFVDYLILGEGEETFPELISYIANEKPKESFKKIKGIVFSEGSKIIKTAPRPVVNNLDALPFPARHLLPLAEYFDARRTQCTAEELGKERLPS